MKIKNLLNDHKICISCEMFPPKAGGELANALDIVGQIAQIGPKYISVTYGAGGTTAGKTVAIAQAIQQQNIPALAHLTCMGATREKIGSVLHQLQELGVENILALRGDRIPGMSEDTADFAHASDLIPVIKASGDFCVGGACYPEGHPESGTLEQDIENTKKKIDAGCDFLVTQMAFDNNIIYNYMFRLLSHGIDVPVVPGIMPVTNAKQIARICQLSGTKLPANFRAIIERFATEPKALQQAGIAYATGQIVDLVANGFRNVHVYTMNKPEIFAGIMRNLSEIVK